MLHIVLVFSIFPLLNVFTHKKIISLKLDVSYFLIFDAKNLCVLSV